MSPQLVTITSFQGLKLHSLWLLWIAPYFLTYLIRKIQSSAKGDSESTRFFLPCCLEVARTLPPFVPLSPGQELFQMLCQSYSPAQTHMAAPFPHIRAMLLHDLVHPHTPLQPQKFPQPFNKAGQLGLGLHLWLSLDAFPSNRHLANSMLLSRVCACWSILFGSLSPHQCHYSASIDHSLLSHPWMVTPRKLKLPGDLEDFLWPGKQPKLLWELFWIMITTQ